MAIYKNREVSVVGPSPQANTPESINVEYKDGTHENVALSGVKFTEEEKKRLQKANPGKYDNVETISEDDLKAVRLGVAPPSDPAVREQARLLAQREQQEKVAREQTDRAKAEQAKIVQAELNKPATPSTPKSEDKR